MLINSDYLRVHEQLIHDIDNGIRSTVNRSGDRFATTMTGVKGNGSHIDHITTEYNLAGYDDELAEYMKARAQIRAIALCAFRAMWLVANSTETELEAIDQIADVSCNLLSGGAIVRLSVTDIRNDGELVSSIEANFIDGGFSRRLNLVCIDGEYVWVREDASLEHDEELDRVYKYVLPGLDDASHATLTNLLAGRIKDTEAAAAPLLKPYIGTSQEEEATRIFDIVVERSAAAVSARSLGSLGLSLPSAQGLQEWADLFADG